MGEEELKKRAMMPLSEIRMERPAANVMFSDSCPCCGNKKRRCLVPSPTPRKKVLVFDENDNAGTLPAHSSPSPSPLSISFSVPTVSTTSTPSISPLPQQALDAGSFSLPSTPLSARSKLQSLVGCNSSPNPRGSTTPQASNGSSLGIQNPELTPASTPPLNPSSSKQRLLERSGSSKASNRVSFIPPSPTSTPPLTPSNHRLLEKSNSAPKYDGGTTLQMADCGSFTLQSYESTPPSTSPLTPSSNQNLLKKSSSDLKVAAEGPKGEEVRVGIKCGCGILREICLIR